MARPPVARRETAKPRSQPHGAKPPVARIELRGMARVERVLLPARRAIRACRRVPLITGMIAGILAAILAIALAPGHFAIEKVDDNLSSH